MGFYNNVNRKAVDWQGYIFPAELHWRKIRLCLWKNHRSIIHFHFLNSKQTLSSNLYSHHLQGVHNNLRGKRLHFSVGETLCFSLIMQDHIKEESLGENIGFTAWYLLDLATSDLHNFGSWQIALSDKNFLHKIRRKCL